MNSTTDLDFEMSDCNIPHRADGSRGAVMCAGRDAFHWKKQFGTMCKMFLPEVHRQPLSMMTVGSLSGLAAVTSGAGSKGKEPFCSGGYQKQKAGVTGLKFFLNLLRP